MMHQKIQVVLFASIRPNKNFKILHIQKPVPEVISFGFSLKVKLVGRWGALTPKSELKEVSNNHVPLKYLRKDSWKSWKKLKLGSDRDDGVLIRIPSNSTQPHPLDRFYRIRFQEKQVRKYLTVLLLSYVSHLIKDILDRWKVARHLPTVVIYVILMMLAIVS